MAANTVPVFVEAPKGAVVQVSTANPNRDGTGTLGTLATGVADGKILEGVRVVATGTTTAGVVRLFLSTDGGATKRLLMEILVSAVTPSASVEVFSAERIFSRPLILQDAGAIVYASTQNAETFNVFTLGEGDF